MAVFEKGQVAVITGAASGIGRAAARRVAAAGMRVVLVLRYPLQVALSVAVGLHTSRILFLFVPLNAYATSMLIVLAVTMMFMTPRARGYEWVLLPVTLGGLLWLELSILIVPLALNTTGLEGMHEVRIQVQEDMGVDAVYEFDILPAEQRPTQEAEAAWESIQ